MEFATRQEYLDFFAPHAQAASQKTGLPASVILAQLIQESGWKLSGLARNALNFFGIKAHSSWDGATYTAGTWEEVNGRRVPQTAIFRSYDTVTDAFVDHGNFLRNNQRYSRIFEMSSPFDIADELQRAGYATDSGYAAALKSIINDNDLTQYDMGGSKWDWSRVWDYINPFNPKDNLFTLPWVRDTAQSGTKKFLGLEGVQEVGIKIGVYVAILVLVIIIILVIYGAVMKGA